MVNSALGPLRPVDLGNAAEILEVDGASVFRVELSKVDECSCT
jgi:hypothetical protein